MAGTTNNGGTPEFVAFVPPGMSQSEFAAEWYAAAGGRPLPRRPDPETLAHAMDLARRDRMNAYVVGVIVGLIGGAALGWISAGLFGG